MLNGVIEATPILLPVRAEYQGIDL